MGHSHKFQAPNFRQKTDTFCGYKICGKFGATVAVCNECREYRCRKHAPKPFGVMKRRWDFGSRKVKQC